MVQYSKVDKLSSKTCLLLEGDNLLDPVLDKLPLCHNKLLALLGRLVEKARVDLK